MPLRSEHFGRRVEFSHCEVVQGGEGIVQMLVDGLAHSSTPAEIGHTRDSNPHRPI
jgi:hypothetical protein